MSNLDLGKNSFIDAYQIIDTTVCDDLIDYWKTSPLQTPGRNYNSSGNIEVNKEIKDSIDVPIYPNEQTAVFRKYTTELQKAVNSYIDKFSACNWSGPWKIIEVSTIQYYPTGGGYKSWHSERGVNAYPITTRHLAWMTYLNDVDESGETEFLYQEIKFKPKKGLTLIWPADWTHTHRGIPSLTEEKYIITGWFNFVDRILE